VNTIVPLTRTLLVERCIDCPFCNEGQWPDPRCMARGTEEGRKLSGEQAPGLKPPKWCLLRGGAVHVRIGKKGSAL
jgi:hypothetical protein